MCIHHLVETRIHYLDEIHIHTHIYTIVMNIQAFNANELDAIYDACIAHMYCTDDDSVADACHTIINKMHIFCTMNQDQV
jgi:hypothetical protein